MGDRLGIPGAVSFSFFALAAALFSIWVVPASVVVAYGHTTLNTPSEEVQQSVACVFV